MKERSAFFSRSINRLHLILLLAMGIYMLMGGSTAYGYLGCLGVLAFFLRNELSLKDTFAAERRMTPFAFVLLLFVAQTLNFTHIVFNYAAETVLNTFGYTVGGFIHEEIKVWTYEKTPFHEVLLFGFFGPVVEEIIIRGYLMRSYQQYSGSKIYAIVFSAIIFGVSHSNIHTSIPIIFDALVLGYIAMEYGIGWTMIYHSIENYLTSHIFMDEIVMQLPADSRFPVSFSVFFVIAVCAAVILIFKRTEIAEYIRENRCESSDVRLTLQSPAFLLYIAVFMLLSLPMISKMS